MENSRVLEDGSLSSYEGNYESKIGQLLQEINLEGYEYLNKAASPKRYKKKKDIYSMSSGFDT